MENPVETLGLSRLLIGRTARAVDGRVTDRVVQNAVRMVIEPIFERGFAPHSYGFRPGRSCKEALRRVEELLKTAHLHVVDIDIKGYFDNIPQDKLMARVGEHIADGRVLKLLKSFLQAGVMEEGKWEETDQGTPQGGVISPLLANIYLNPVDWLMAQKGYEMVRYADDMVVLCRDAVTAQNALKEIAEWMEEAGLELHPEKTKVVDMTQVGNHFDFLGYRFLKSRKTGRLLPIPRPKSLQKLKGRLKPLTRRSNGKKLETIIATLNPILKGWYNYFRHAIRPALEGVDGWVRERIRGILWRRQKRKGRASPLCHKLWTNRYLHSYGLFSLRSAHENESINHRNC